MSMSHLYGTDGDDGVEMESFEVSDWDLQNEFNPHRQRHRQTKEEATYGVWAERDSDEERPSFGGKRSRDYSAPVSFVSAGLRKAAAEELSDEDSDDDEKPVKQEEIPKEFVPKKLKTGGNFKPSQKGFVGGSKSFVDFGSWERHTKGIGQKLLQKMGYVPGRGLGKNAQGIINPIEAKQRKGKGAVGAYGSERTSQSLQDFPVVDSEEEAEEEFQKELSQWRKDPNGGKKKPKYSYKTVEELKAKGRINKQLAAPQKELSQVKVIDMTGREQKVYYSYSQISHKHNIPDDSPQQPLGKDSKPQGFALPELEHNLQLLIDITEQEIIQSDRQLQYERDMVVNLSHEIQKMAEVLSHEEKAISNLSKVLDMVEECERRMQPSCENPLTLDECAKIFETLQDKYYEEYRMSDRVDLAVAIVYPLMKEYFKNWDPLKDCTYGTEIIAKWKSLLENDQLLSHSGQDLSTDAFHRLMWEIWMPYVRNIVARWQPRNCGSMVDFLDGWVNVVPVWILDNILDQLIFPKLQKEVESWNPLTDTVPIHSWIHPWLPLMQARLEPLYSPIRNKLANALQKWHPSDSSAKLILQPWKDVFTPGSWEAFMVKNIVPKLGMCLNELIINPHQQHMDAFYWVIDWEGMISVSSLVGLLEKHFFPKWLQVLCSWLSNSPNYEEITKWYLGWKSMFSDQVLAHPSIKDKFNEALDIMNRAVSSSVGGYMQPGARENIAYLTHTERRKDFQYEAMQERREAENMAQRGIGAAAGSVPMNFKDLIQTKAEEHNIVFMPIIGKRHEGKHLYTFGRIVIYIDRGVVFVQGEKTWVPTSLQSLIDMAK
ncbi:TFP11 protein, partial [Edolisoma coerulescens]|nr:TFP11 protein [Edolisoma coerulescens]